MPADEPNSLVLAARIFLLQHLIAGGIGAMLVNESGAGVTHTWTGAEEFVSDVAAGAIVDRISGITGVTVAADGTLQCDNFALTGTVDPDPDAESILFYADGGSDQLSRIILRLTSATGMPVDPDGTSINVQCSSGILQIGPGSGNAEGSGPTAIVPYATRTYLLLYLISGSGLSAILINESGDAEAHAWTGSEEFVSDVTPSSIIDRKDNLTHTLSGASLVVPRFSLANSNSLDPELEAVYFFVPGADDTSSRLVLRISAAAGLPIDPQGPNINVIPTPAAPALLSI